MYVDQKMSFFRSVIMEIINFPDFLSKIITGINVNNTDVPEYAEFVQIIDRICSDGDLEKSYDEFIDNICAKLPARFLICQIVDQQFTNVVYIYDQTAYFTNSNAA